MGDGDKSLSMDPNKVVGMIGLGAMGKGIATNLCHFVKDTCHKDPLMVWNRTASKADDLVAEGARFAQGGVAEVACTCDITFCMPFDDASLIQIIEEFSNNAKPGSTFVSMPTVHPSTTTKASSIAKQAGVSFLACPVFGRPEAARNKTLVCVVAGPTEAKAAAAPYLAAIGRETLDLGEEPAIASVQKLVGNYMIVGTVELLAEAMTLGDKNGLSREHFLNFVRAFFPAPAVTGYATRMATSAFSTNGGQDGFSVAGGIKDASLMVQLAKDSGVHGQIVEAALQNLKKQREEGGEDKDWGSLVEVIRKDAGI